MLQEISHRSSNGSYYAHGFIGFNNENQLSQQFLCILIITKVINNYPETGEIKKYVKNTIKSKMKFTDPDLSFVIFLETTLVDVQFMPQKNIAAFKVSKYNCEDKNAAYMFLEEALKLKIEKISKLKDVKPLQKMVHAPNFNLPPTFTNSRMFTTKYLSKIQNHSSSFRNISFKKELTESITILGQIQQSFIACVLKQKLFNVIIIIDPHGTLNNNRLYKATDERIKLEALMDKYLSYLTSAHNDYYTEIVPIPKNFYEIFESHDNCLSIHGITMNVRNIQEQITLEVSVPHLLLPQYANKKDLKISMTQLVLKCLRWVQKSESDKYSSGSSFQCEIPAPILDILNSKACRSAVMFGSTINKEQSRKLIKDVMKCKYPFQCAHGRPTLVPILLLNETERVCTKRNNWAKWSLHSRVNNSCYHVNT